MKNQNMDVVYLKFHWVYSYLTRFLIPTENLLYDVYQRTFLSKDYLISKTSGFHSHDFACVHLYILLRCFWKFEMFYLMKWCVVLRSISSFIFPLVGRCEQIWAPLVYSINFILIACSNLIFCKIPIRP